VQQRHHQKKVLIVDDELLIRYSLQNLIEGENYKAITADSGLHALKSFEEEKPDIVILDIRLPDSNGLTLLKTIKDVNPAVTVIMMTACPDIPSSVEAMKMGALDYLEKPIDFDKLKNLLLTLKHSHSEGREPAPHDNFVFKSEAMKEVYRITERLAKADVSLLVLGESGTGKSFLCKTVHNLSSRNNLPFIEIGCSNIPEHLIESELFGYEKGSFTDAKSMKKGLIEMAEGGTVFFDEIGDMPYPMQSKLLTLIEERKFRRIGGLREINADVRIVAATNRNLYELVQAGTFRLDLFYRLNVVTIEMPPLRDRKEDIPLLADHYLKRYSSKYRCQAKGMSPETLDTMQNYGWPGNVRELKNLIEKMVIMSKCEKIGVDDLPPCFLSKQGAPDKVKAAEHAGCPSENRGRSGLSLKVLEEESIREALKLSKGNQRKAAKLLDISRDTLRYRLKKWGINSSLYL
jgi:DNA-binding NtrC family response regulator